MPLYRKKPVTVDAFKFSGTIDADKDPDWIVEAVQTKQAKILRDENGTALQISMDGDVIVVPPGTYIVKCEDGSYHPYEEHFFEKEFELVCVYDDACEDDDSQIYEVVELDFINNTIKISPSAE